MEQGVQLSGHQKILGILLGFYWLYKEDPENELAEDFIYAAFASANTVKFTEKSIELGEQYLANKNWLKYGSTQPISWQMLTGLRLKTKLQLLKVFKRHCPPR